MADKEQDRYKTVVVPPEGVAQIKDLAPNDVDWACVYDTQLNRMAGLFGPVSSEDSAIDAGLFTMFKNLEVSLLEGSHRRIAELEAENTELLFRLGGE